MEIEEREYTHQEFKNYIIEHSDEILDEDLRKRWLKIYCILVSDDSWKNRLFRSSEMNKMGDIFKVSMNRIEDGEKEQYYIEEYCPGLLLIYNTATDEEYERHIGDTIDHNIGIARMWMKPDIFNIFWKGILEETNGFIYRFTSRRGSLDNNHLNSAKLGNI